MKIKLVHPFWTHLPAITALLTLVIYAIVSGPLPASAPVHFGPGGHPDDYGSPWLVIGLIIGLSILFIALSTFLDELWARQEKRKSFNWLSLMDEVVVGSMAGINLGYLAAITNNSPLYTFRWDYFLPFFGGSILLGILVEMIRPFRPHAESMMERKGQNDAELRAEMEKRLDRNMPFIYWDYQNPLYISLLATILPLILVTAGILTWFDDEWVSVLLFVVGILLIIPYGGQRVLVTPGDVTVRWGILGLRVLHLKATDIVEVEQHEFSPIRDFGGYGIRFNREMKAYYLRGTLGVKITLRNGKKYLIGSDNAARLAAVISAVQGVSS